MTANNLYYNDENSNGYVGDFFMAVERENNREARFEPTPRLTTAIKYARTRRQV